MNGIWGWTLEIWDKYFEPKKVRTKNDEQAKEKSPGFPKTLDVQSMDPSGKVLRARAWLSRCDPAIMGKQGRRQTGRAAKALVIDFSLSTAEAWPLLEDYNARCQPPWDLGQLHDILEWAASGEGDRGSKLRNTGGFIPRAGGEDLAWLNDVIIKVDCGGYTSTIGPDGTGEVIFKPRVSPFSAEEIEMIRGCSPKSRVLGHDDDDDDDDEEDCDCDEIDREIYTDHGGEGADPHREETDAARRANELGKKKIAQTQFIVSAKSSAHRKRHVHGCRAENGIALSAA